MSKDCLDRKQIRAVLIEMGPESMTERMAGKPSGFSKPILVFVDMSRKEESIDGSAGILLFGEQPSRGSVVRVPVFCEVTQCHL